MVYFEWTPEIAVGHARMDDDHKQLFALAEAVVEPLFATAEHQPKETSLAALIDFARRHFTYEQELMRTSGYPEAEAHANFHTLLLRELETYFAKVHVGANTNPAGLIAYLWNWLVVHMQTADRQLAAWLASR
jgi:hemerythrin-like metal-binding protein